MLKDKVLTAPKGNLNILYADDCEIDFEFYSQVISDSLRKSHDINIDNCVALDEIKQKISSNNNYNIIILDLNLIDSGGVETFDKVKEMVKSKTPIIIVSGINDVNIRNQCIKAGAGDFLIKGVNDNNLIGIILNFVLEQKKMENNLKNAY